MGYAMFAARKIMLTDSINTTQLELTQISNQLMDLADLGAAVSDGEISAFDIAECQQAGIAVGAGWDMATGQYTDPYHHVGWLEAENEARSMTGGSWMANITGAGIGAGLGALASSAAVAAGVASGPVGWLILGAGALGAIIGNQCSAKTQQRNQYMKQYNEASSEKNQEKIARDLQQKIARMENELEKRKNNLDTKLQAYNAEFESVKQAESQGIKNATPNYAGG